MGCRPENLVPAGPHGCRAIQKMAAAKIRGQPPMSRVFYRAVGARLLALQSKF